MGDYSPIQQSHALWILHRFGAIVVRSDADPLVRIHWLRAAGERERVLPSLRDVLLRYLSNDDAQVRRAAVESLARHPSTDNIIPLLHLRRGTSGDDPQLLHAVRMATRNQLQVPDALQAVAAMNLDDSDIKNLADVVPGVPTPAAADWLNAYLHRHNESPANFAQYVAHVTRHCSADRLAELIAFSRSSCGDELRRQSAIILVLSESLQSRSAKMPVELANWGAEAGRELIATGDVPNTREAIRLTRALKIDTLVEAIERIAAGEGGFDSLRGEALSTLAELDSSRFLPLLSGILGNPTEPLPLRQHAASVLAQQQRPEVHDELVRQLRVAPEQLAVYIAAALAGGAAGAEKLLDEVGAGKVAARILLHPLVNGRVLSARLPDAQQRIARLTEGLPPVEERLQKSIQSRSAGFATAAADRDRGAKIFEKHCAICHTIVGRGAKIGPQLDGIGVRGLDRILEDVLDPNRNVDQAFRASIIALKNGRVLTGLVLNDEGDLVTLADAQGQQSQTPKADIEERTTSRISPMPANVMDLLTEAEFYDLIAFLLGQREPRPE
jgi:putative heme-binding domain-containing protein